MQQFLKAVAFTLAVINAGLAGAVILLAALNREGSEIDRLSWPDLPPSLSFSLVGALIISRRPRHTIGWLLLLIGLPLVLEHFGIHYATYALLTRPGSLPGGVFVSWMTFGVFGLSYGAIVLLVLLFPTGQPLSRRWAWAGVVGMGGGVLWSLLTYISAWKFRGPLLLQDEIPPGLKSAQALAMDILSVMTAAFLVALVSTILRLRQSSGVERQQLKWFVYAAALAVGVMVKLIISDDRSNTTLEDIIDLILYSFAFSAIPIAIGVAILRYRLWDIDLIIRRTLIYGVLTAILALIYFGSVVLLQAALHSLTGHEPSELATVGSTLLIAALFTPLRRRIQTMIDRRFYRRKYDAAKTLATFSSRLRDEVNLDRLAAELVQVVEETMQPAHISLWLRDASNANPQRYLNKDKLL
jgi:hypothetical protein